MSENGKLLGKPKIFSALVMISYDCVLGLLPSPSCFLVINYPVSKEKLKYFGREDNKELEEKNPTVTI